MQADAIDEIVATLAAQHRSWPRAGGWAPSNAAALLEVARLDRQLSFAHTLRDNFVPFPKESADARQILGYATLRSLCEGAIQLFITVYYNDYIKDEKPIPRRKGEIVDPENAQFSDLIKFYLIHGDPAFEPFLARVKARGNTIHHFRDRVIGTEDELKADVIRLRDFLASTDTQLPDPPPHPDPDPDW
jgi:hypothetical protein